MPENFFDRIAFLLSQYGNSYLYGAYRTIIIAIAGTFFGCVIGFIIGVIQAIPINQNDKFAKKSTLKFVRGILTVYVEFFRGTPMMVQAMFIYYGAMQLLNFDMSIWFAGIFIVSINTGAYMAETVRGGISSIDTGQTDGAKAIGMNHSQTMTYVIIPQALRNIMPQIGNNLIINIKDSSVLSVISVTELFFTGKSVSGVYYTYFESMFIVCIIYLIITVSCSLLLRILEKRMDGAKTYDLATKDTLAHTSGMTRHIRKNDRH